MADAVVSDIHSGKSVRLHDLGGNVYAPEVWVTSGTISAAATGLVRTDPPTSIFDGRKVVTTAGTSVALSGAQPCLQVTITALSSNTNLVVVGGSTVVAALATRRGTPLAAGQSVTIPISDASAIHLDAMISGEGVTFSGIAQ